MGGFFSALFGGGGGAAMPEPAPAPTIAPPAEADAAAQAQAASETKRRRLGAINAQQTILTSAEGAAGTAPTAKKTLLGA